MLYTPLVIAFCLVLFKFIPICLIKILRSLGSNSMNMWLIHSFYCYYFYNIGKIIYYSKIPCFALLILIGFTYMSSLLIERIYLLLGVSYNR